MAKFPELDSTASINSTFRRIYNYTDGLLDEADLRVDHNGNEPTRKVGGTSLILSSGYSVYGKTQWFHRTLSFIGDRSKTFPLVKVTSTGSTGNTQLNRADAVPEGLQIYPQAIGRIQASIRRVAGRPEDRVHLSVSDTSTGNKTSGFDVSGIGNSEELCSSVVGALSPESTNRLRLIYGGLQIATSSIVLLLAGETTKVVQQQLQADYTALFIPGEQASASK